ncbi:CdaR family protein, partial [Clostridiaceae bacterium HSG29]|nr:CdaR family protein [Clostridiaceae bacterium HSG29]
TKEMDSIKVELLNVDTIEDNGLLIMNNKEFFVDIILEGRRDEILSLNKNDILLSADLMGYKSGMNVIKINSKSNNKEIEIKKLSEDDIKIQLEKLVEKPKPVKIEFVGQLEDRYRVSNSKTDINEILVKGPESLVNSVKYLIGTVNLSDKKSSFQNEVVIVPVDDENIIIQGLDVNQKYVNTSLDIVKQKEVKVEMEIVDNTTEDYSLKKYAYYPKTIEIEGPEKLIDDIEMLNVKEFDVTDDLGTFSVDENVILPENIVLVNSFSVINVYGEVEPIEVKEYEIAIKNIAILNLDKEFEFRIIEDIKTVNLKMRAPKSLLDSIQKDDIEFQLDASNLVEGLNNEKLKLNINTEAIECTITPEKINVEIYKIEETEGE